MAARLAKASPASHARRLAFAASRSVRRTNSFSPTSAGSISSTDVNLSAGSRSRHFRIVSDQRTSRSGWRDLGAGGGSSSLFDGLCRQQRVSLFKNLSLDQLEHRRDLKVSHPCSKPWQSNAC